MTFVLLNNFFPEIVHFLCNVLEYGTAKQTTDNNKIRRVRIACWITNGTNTHSEYVIFIAFPRQQCLCK